MSGTYDRWATPALWEMFAGDRDADTTAHLNAWNEKWQLLYDQGANLGGLRDQLAQYWDPTGSPAAQKFLDRIDQVLGVVEANRTAVAAIWQTYQHVTNAMRDAGNQIAQLSVQYADPAATEESRKETDQQARTIMESMDKRIAEATANPTVIDPMKGRDEVDDQPATDPVVTTGNAGSDGGGSTASSSIVQPPFNPPAPTSTSTIVGGIDGTPALAGAPAPSTFTAPPASPPVISAPPAHAGPIVGPLPGTVRPGEPLSRPSPSRFSGVIGEPQARPIATPLRSTAVSADGVIRGGSVSPEPGIRAAPPMSPAGAGPVSRRATRRAVIGDGYNNAASPPAARGGWQDTSYEAYARRRAKRKDDPDNPWTVEEGVAPVLEASNDLDDHGATPGVIGLDR